MSKKVACFNESVKCSHCEKDNYIQLGFDEDWARIECGDCGGAFLVSLSICVKTQKLDGGTADQIGVL